MDHPQEFLEYEYSKRKPPRKYKFPDVVISAPREKQLILPSNISANLFREL